MTTHYETGSNRDGREGKVSYAARNPISEQSFAKYMMSHSVLADGTRRPMNNWWKGMSLEHDKESLDRHYEDIHALHGGMYVYKEKIENGELTHFSMTKVEKDGWREIGMEEALNALEFNVKLYKIDYLKK